MTTQTAEKTLDQARAAFEALCDEWELVPFVAEHNVLQAGRDFLPACAIAVLDGEDGTVEYYEWLTDAVNDAELTWRNEAQSDPYHGVVS